MANVDRLTAHCTDDLNMLAGSGWMQSGWRSLGVVNVQQWSAIG